MSKPAKRTEGLIGVRTTLEGAHLKLIELANAGRDVCDNMSCEDYGSERGQRLEKIVLNLELAEAYLADAVACLVRAEKQ